MPSQCIDVSKGSCGQGLWAIWPAVLFAWLSPSTGAFVLDLI
ncbi:hypothetical protein PRBEI_2000564600 [Prionailurus iriomotensis]